MGGAVAQNLAYAMFQKQLPKAQGFDPSLYQIAGEFWGWDKWDFYREWRTSTGYMVDQIALLATPRRLYLGIPTSGFTRVQDCLRASALEKDTPLRPHG